MDNLTLIKAENISKSFRNTKKIKLDVLKQISFEVEEGKISVIVGASGAGKSTLLHILGGLDRPDSGMVIFNSENIFDLSDEKLAKFRNGNVGFVFQFHHLLPEFSAVENVAIPLMINGTSLSKALIRSKELIELVGLKERAEHKPAELSGGEQQRVAVARALANDPKIILADEPTGNLDSANSEALNQIIVDLKNKFNKTFVIVTHNKDLMNLADRLFIMKDGQIYSES